MLPSRPVPGRGEETHVVVDEASPNRSAGGLVENAMQRRQVFRRSISHRSRLLLSSSGHATPHRSATVDQPGAGIEADEECEGERVGFTETSRSEWIGVNLYNYDAVDVGSALRPIHTQEEGTPCIEGSG